MRDVTAGTPPRRRPVVVAAVVLLAILAIPFGLYGTLSPCRMLDIEVERFALRQGLDPLVLRRTMRRMGGSFDASLGPVGCAKAVIRIHTEGIPMER